MTPTGFGFGDNGLGRRARFAEAGQVLRQHTELVFLSRVESFR